MATKTKKTKKRATPRKRVTFYVQEKGKKRKKKVSFLARR